MITHVVRPRIMEEIDYTRLAVDEIWAPRGRGSLTVFHNNENNDMNVMIEVLECIANESGTGLKARRVASDRYRNARCTGGGTAWKR